MITKQKGGGRAFQAEEATPLKIPNVAGVVQSFGVAGTQGVWRVNARLRRFD